MSIATEPAADLELRLSELQHTDAEAFMEMLFRAFYRSLGNIVFRVVQDRAVAEDLVQDVLLNVWKNRDTLHITSTYQAYLYRAAMNAALRHAARQKRQVAWNEASLPGPGRNTTDEQVHGQESEAAIAAAALLTTTACDREGDLLGPIVRGTGPTQTETRTINNFSRLELKIDADVILTQGSPQQVHIEAQRNILDVLKTELAGDKLKIECGRYNVRGHDPVRIYITVPALTEVEVSGAGKVSSTTPWTATSYQLPRGRVRFG